jgi:hypothetical protein
MNKKSLITMASMMFLAADSFNHPTRKKEILNKTLTDDEKRERFEKLQRSKGLKKFFVEGKEIWALNEKRAIEKSLKA